MIANFKININSFSSSSASTVNIPISIKYQIVDNYEEIENKFVYNEVKKSINCILDYDKIKFTPVDNSNKELEIVNITYKINLLDSSGNYITPSYLSDLGLTNDDIEFRKNSFNNGFLFLQFYDDFNPQTRVFLTESQIYNSLYPETALNNGKLKSVNQIPLEYISSNSKIVQQGIYTGFNVYDYIDKYSTNNQINSIYCSAHLFNAKTGKIIDFMTTQQAPTIDQLPRKQFMKFDLKKTSKGYVYKIDSTFNNNFVITPVSNSALNTRGYNDMTINLYQVKVV